MTVVRDSENTRKIALIVEYDGTNYQGFEWQPAAPTIQGELEEAIYKTTQERLRVVAASRTDAGVHAKGQVVSFRTTSRLPPETIRRALNHYLPKDIVVLEAASVSSDFNVQRDAISREYRYYILDSAQGSALCRRYACPSPGPLDVEAMNRACALLIGQHDFISFASKLGKEPRNTVRTVYEARVEKHGHSVMFRIVANSFLPHQIRHIVGALIKVGLGKMDTGDFGGALASKQRGIAAASVPARGLCLIKVNYPRFPET